MESAAASHCEPDLACNASERGAPFARIAGLLLHPRGDDALSRGRFAFVARSVDASMHSVGVRGHASFSFQSLACCVASHCEPDLACNASERGAPFARIAGLLMALAELS